MSHVGFDLQMRDIFVPHIQAAETQLFSAARNGDIATVRRLVTKGNVDINVKDQVSVSSLPSCLPSLKATHSSEWVGYNRFLQSLSWSHVACNTLQWKDFSAAPSTCR